MLWSAEVIGRKGEVGIGLFRLCRRKWSDIVFVSVQGDSLGVTVRCLEAKSQRNPFQLHEFIGINTIYRVVRINICILNIFFSDASPMRFFIRFYFPFQFINGEKCTLNCFFSDRSFR